MNNTTHQLFFKHFQECKCIFFLKKTSLTEITDFVTFLYIFGQFTWFFTTDFVLFEDLFQLGRVKWSILLVLNTNFLNNTYT